MKTLEELGMTLHKTSNYADYRFGREKICCGWMDIHEDSDNLDGDRKTIFVVVPLYWDPEAVFIFKPRTKWHCMTIQDFKDRKPIPGISYTDQGFVFNATRYHGLVPQPVAQRLNDPGYTTSNHYKEFAASCQNRTKPKLIWCWGENTKKTPSSQT